MASSPSHGCTKKTPWWLTNKKIVDMYIKDARSLISSQEQSNIESAINLLNDALALSPNCEPAMELKATALLHLRRYNEVADMLQDYIPSMKMTSDDSSSSASSTSSFDNHSQPFARERVKLLSDAGDGDSPTRSEQSCKCFSVSDLKMKVTAGFVRNRNKERQWRYLILGQACCHLGLLNDAITLLQTGKRLASAALRRESIHRSDDSFTSSGDTFTFTFNQPQPHHPDSEHITNLLSHIKLLLRRKAAAIAAADAGLYTESIRHFSKILDGRRAAQPHFLAECYIRRAAAYRSAGKLTESIADCNRTLSLDPSCIEALTIRSTLYETINCVPDSLHDLEHLKLLYNSILRDRKLAGPAWKRQTAVYSEIPVKLRSISIKIENLKMKVASGEITNVDYYALMGLRRGCCRGEIERSHLLLVLRHKPDKFMSFIDRCEFWDEGEVEAVRERARMAGLMLYRLIQRGYTSMMRAVLDEEALEKQRKAVKSVGMGRLRKKWDEVDEKNVFRGVFCRDLAVVGSLLAQTGFNRSIQVKYEGLSC